MTVLLTADPREPLVARREPGRVPHGSARVRAPPAAAHARISAYGVQRPGLRCTRRRTRPSRQRGDQFWPYRRAGPSRG